MTIVPSDNMGRIKVIQDHTTMNFLVLTLCVFLWIIFQHNGGILAIMIGPVLLAILHNRNEESGSELEA